MSKQSEGNVLTLSKNGVS